jgi:TrmH family RNA methyltransferase
VLSRNKIKYLASLKIKKFRTLHSQFLMEGDKIVKDILCGGKVTVTEIIASGTWIRDNQAILNTHVKLVTEADSTDLSRITTLETPPPVIAVFDVSEAKIDHQEVNGSLSIALDNIQDPGNLGTIIRTADWFGIRNIFCTRGCPDMYNPKVIQASMGAILNVNVHYTDFKDLLNQYSRVPDFTISGTFIEGTSVFTIRPVKCGIILFGNESRGISNDYLPYIRERITIPAASENRTHVESLNVASSVAVICAVMRRSNEQLAMNNEE